MILCIILDSTKKNEGIDLVSIPWK